MSNRKLSITLFGATGKTGQAIIAEAKYQNSIIQPVTKRSLTKTELSQAIQGSDVVVIVFGPSAPYTDIFCADTTQRIIQAMEGAHVKRLICQTGAMIGNYPKNRSYFFQKMSDQFKKSNPAGYTDRVMQEEAIKGSNLDWTIIKPPRLTDSNADIAVKSGMHVSVGLLSSISRKSLARFIFEEIQKPRYIHQAVFVKN